MTRPKRAAPRIRSQKTTPSLLSRPELWWFMFAVAMLVVAFVRLRLLGTPLERDEGDYAYHGQMMLDGVSLSDELIRKRFPAIFYLYSIMLAVFGQSARAIHLGLLIVNLATVWLIVRFVRRWFPLPVAIASGITFAILTLTPVVHGFSTNREHFLMLAVLGAMNVQYLAFKRQKGWLYYAAGFLYGLAFIIKEPSVFFIVFGGIWFLIESLREKPVNWRKFLIRGGLFTIGVFTPYLVVIAYFWMLGVLDEFILRNYTLKRKYASRIETDVGLRSLRTRLKELIAVSPVLWLMLIPGFLAPVFQKGNRRILIVLLVFGVLSFLSTVPGLYFRPHYFVLLMPAWAILMSVGLFEGLQRFVPNKKSIMPIALLLLLIGWGYALVDQRTYLFKADTLEACRINYGYNPFPEAEVIGKYIKQNTQPEDRIMVLGSEPEIYFYAHRKAAIEAIYMYDLMYVNAYASQLQEKTIEQAEKNDPKFVVLVNVAVSWQGSEQSDQHIFEWAQQYLQGYNRVGVVDIIPDKTQYIFGPEATTYKPRSSGHILIFQKRSNQAG